MKETVIRYRNLIFLFFSALTLLFLSYNSFLYLFCMEYDQNCFYSIAKYMMDGKILYKDVFEQKGPCIYFMNILGQILTPGSFHGMYIIEVICAFLYMHITYKTLNIISNSKFLNIFITVMGCASTYLIQGNSPGEIEELCLPMFAYIMYVLIKLICTGQSISKKCLFFVGIHIGIILWSKYTILVFYFGCLIFVIIYYILHNKITEIFRILLWSGLGITMISLFIFVYLIYTDSVKDMIEVYIINNIFGYFVRADFSLYIKRLLILPVFLNIGSAYFCLLFITIRNIKNNNNIKYKYILLCISTVLFVYVLITCYIGKWTYYYIPIGSVYACIVKLYTVMIKNRKTILTVLLMGFIFFFYCQFITNNKNFIHDSKIIYKVSDKIKQNNYTEVLTVGEDRGYFYLLNYLPDEYYYTFFNTRHDETWQLYINKCKTGEVSHIILTAPPQNIYPCLALFKKSGYKSEYEGTFTDSQQVYLLTQYSVP